jgi:hypothetical protein
MTEEQLIERLFCATSQTIIAVRTMIVPKMLAKSIDGVPNPFRIGRGRDASFTIRKSQSLNGLACPNYQRLVLNRHVKVGSVEAPDFGESWHEVITDHAGRPTTLCRHKTTGEAYMRFVPLHRGKPEFHTLDGHAVPSDVVAPYLQASSSYANQNLPEGEEIPFIVLKIASLQSISIDNERYEILR